MSQTRFGTAPYNHPTVQLATRARTAMMHAALDHAQGRPVRPKDQAAIDAWAEHCRQQRDALPWPQRWIAQLRHWWAS